MAPQGAATLTMIIDGRLFRVPDYQRPYAWQQQHLSDLWEDLDLLGGNAHHYAGTLILRKTGDLVTNDESGEELTVVEVVDGQQRLTTCLLLLSRIAAALEVLAASGQDEVHTRARAHAAQIRARFGFVEVSGVRQPRLRLADDLNPFWVDVILDGRPHHAAQTPLAMQLLTQARTFFDEQIAKLMRDRTPEQSLTVLQELRNRLAGRLAFLHYDIDSPADVGVIFETVNDRGRDLTDLEKIKNYLLYLSRQATGEPATELAAHINRQWAVIFGHLADGHVDEDGLLRAHWLATVNPDARHWKRTASVKEKFSRERFLPGHARLSTRDGGSPRNTGSTDDVDADLVAEVRDYVDTLAHSALFLHEEGVARAAYSSFRDSGADPRTLEAIADETECLNRTGITAIFRPLFIAFRLAAYADASAYLELIRLCQAYAVRVFAICQRRSNAGVTYLAAVAYKVSTGAFTTERALDEIRGWVHEYAGDERIASALKDPDNWYERRLHRFMLYEYERHLIGGKGSIPDYSRFVGAQVRRTTEHILPQTPAEGSQWLADFTPAERDSLTHTLGNLMLTFDNSSYSNKDFAAKKGRPGASELCYATSALRQENEVSVVERWDADAIRNRQAKIAAWAQQRWRVLRPARSVTASSEVDAEPALEDVEVGSEVDFEVDEELEDQG